MLPPMRNFKETLINILKNLGLFERAVIIKYLMADMSPSHRRHKNEIAEFYSQFVKRGDLCFDVGANMGTRTEAFLELGATTLAVEPQDLCIRYLKIKFKNKSSVLLVQTACGEEEGKKEIMLNDVLVLSSLSEKWIKSVKDSGRFSHCSWQGRTLVTVIPLDRLIEKYGKPIFCKIDVEGFEFEVLKGLSQPIKNISFEFIPEYIDAAISCIDHLFNIGMTQFNYTIEEKMSFILPHWVGHEEMKKILLSLPDKSIYGDVYARS